MTQFIKPTVGLITSHFSNGRKRPVLGIVRPHQGVDIGKVSSNDQVVAAAAGKVRVYGYHKSAGNYVSIQHPFGMTTAYLHLKSVSVKNGQQVKQGQVIGIKGNTGIGTGVHLHFEVHKTSSFTNDINKKLDPVAMFYDDQTKEWQLALGYKLGAADGYYGPKTVQSVRNFQSDNKLAVDGACGKSTYAAIKKQYEALKKNETKTEEKEVDDMNQELSPTAKKDMRNLLQHAYDTKVFSDNHVPKVDKMTLGEALDLLVSYNARTAK